MNQKQALAVELLMSHPISGVAEMLGVRLATLEKWMQEPSFIQRLKEKEREQKRCLARVSRQAAVEAAAAMCALASDEKKPDPKVLLDILKAAGAFEAEQSDPGESLADLVRLAATQAEEELAQH